jgi:hypothetical protein
MFTDLPMTVSLLQARIPALYRANGYRYRTVPHTEQGVGNTEIPPTEADGICASGIKGPSD